ncbi:MAG: metal ABC transporter substrate-binding protein [Fibromonadales bacterium]|nr:metal ABC transporter substrate-binding protein [Fibromonadales bacterium]
MKYPLGILHLFALFAVLAMSCDEKTSNGKTNVVATIFPLYDFARATAKEKANITMLVAPGNSVHSFEPSPADMKKIQNADVFLYIGGENETWVKRILSALDTSKMKIVRMIDFAKLYKEEDEDDYDEHIWTGPSNAISMINETANALCEKDAANCESYRENAQNYIAQISELSGELSQTVNSAKRKLIVVADRFPFRYLTEEYGLEYAAAFPGCSDQSNASAKTIASLIKTVKENKVPYIYHVELSSPKTAESVAEETGAKMLLLHSYHNLSKQDFEKGLTYLDFLRQNAKNLKTGLWEE